MGSRPQARSGGAPLPPASAPGPALGAHSLHAGVRVWADLSALFSCVPRGSEGRGPGGLQEALTEPALKTESTGQVKRPESVPPPSASANQRQEPAGCSTSAPPPPAAGATVAVAWLSWPALPSSRVRRGTLLCGANRRLEVLFTLLESYERQLDACTGSVLEILR